jgi:hypothetical protein
MSYQQRTGVELFIGLGPLGESISEEAIRAKLEETQVAVLAVRKRGKNCYVDVADDYSAQRVISALNGQYIGEARMTVDYSNQRARGDFNRKPDYGGRGRGQGGHQQAPRGDGVELFVGLGPKGNSITEEQLAAHLSKSRVTILAVRARGTRAFVDVATVGDAEKLISAMSGQLLQESRLEIKLNTPQDRPPRRV